MGDEIRRGLRKLYNEDIIFSKYFRVLKSRRMR
jgi:hypothetical protein